MKKFETLYELVSDMSGII